MSSSKKTRKNQGLPSEDAEVMPTLPLEVDTDSAANSASDAASASVRSVSNTKKLVSNVLQAARAVAGALTNQEIPNPALLSGTAALKESIGELLKSGDLESLEASASRLIQDAYKEVPTQVKQFCEINALHLGGAFPDYVISGTVYLKIDTKRCRVQINDLICPMFPVKDFLDRVRDEVSKYSSGEFQATRFLSQLWQAYQLCVGRRKSSKNASGERVSVFEILPEVAFTAQSRQFSKSPTKGAFRPYSQHMFRADLYRLISAAAEPVVDGLRLVLEPTSVAEDGLFMFVPSL